VRVLSVSMESLQGYSVMRDIATSTITNSAVWGSGVTFSLSP